MKNLYTIGYAGLSSDTVIEHLELYGVRYVVDVRSHPYSSYFPNFDRPVWSEFLRTRGLEYVFLGEELGARRVENDAYGEDGRVRFDKVAEFPIFKEGIETVKRLGGTSALFCAEADHMECHRTLLVAKALRDDFDIYHILPDGTQQSGHAAETLLIEKFGPGDDFFVQTGDAKLEIAYAKAADKIAHRRL